ncbi:MAG: AI-2E family transporter [Verrucomicrobiales bacterium]|nr:AI-2E family transporter [Verrucomicrobiales bacterium]
MSVDTPTSPEQQAVPARRRFPTDFQRKTLWSAITALSILAIGGVAVLVVWVVKEVFTFLQPVLVPLAGAGILAYLLEPIVKRLTRRGTPRFRAMVWVFTLFHVLMLFLFLSVVVPTVGHLSNWAGRQNLSTIVVGLERTADKIMEPLDRFFAPPQKKEALEKALEAEEKAGEKAAAKEGDAPPGPTVPPAAPAPEETKPPATVQETAPDKPAGGPNRWWREWFNDPEHVSAFNRKAWEYLSAGFQGFLGTFGYIVGFLMVPFYLYYFLKEAEAIRSHWSKYLPLRSSRFKTEVVETLDEINGYLAAFFRGTMMVSTIDGFLVAVLLMILGLPYAPLIGLCVALLGLLPYVGHMLCWMAAIIISIIHFSVVDNRWASMPDLWAYPVLVTLIFVVVMKINALVTAPKIIGDAVGLHPLTVIFSVLFWSLLLGPILGALLAVPLSAAVKVLFRRYLWERTLQGKLAPPEAAAAATSAVKPS